MELNLNLLSPNSDQHQISPHQICCIVTQTGHEKFIKEMIYKEDSLFKQFLSIITQWNVWQVVRTICIMMPGLKGLTL